MTPSSPDFPHFNDADLRQRWQGRVHFTVLQNGFGHGAQLLQAWSAWHADADAPERLHYLVIDPQPPTREQLTHWQPALPEQLRLFWPPQVPGYHRLFLTQGRKQFVLTLINGDLASSLPQLEARIDLFLLRSDPAWNAALLKWLGRLAAPQAHVLAQGELPFARREWQQAGFVCENEDGLTPAHFAPRWQLSSNEAPSIERRAIVIGAGLAGSAACESLAARGWQVALIEQHAQAAQEASGNLAGVYMPTISRDDNPTARLTRAAFLFAQQVWARSGVFDSTREAGKACGVLQVARDAEQAAAFEQAAQHWRYSADYAQWLPADEASVRLGMTTGSGWFFPTGGWLRPAVVCEAMLAACGDRVQRHFRQTAASLLRVGDAWQVCDADGRVIARAPVVILANGMHATRFAQADSLPLQAIRGQVSHLPAAVLPDLPFVLCGDGYVTGAVDGMVSVGASYDQDDDPAPRIDSHRGNLDKLGQLLRQPALVGKLMSVAEEAALAGRVGFRCVSADRLPLIGALPDRAALADAGELQLRAVPRQPQLHGLLAYASRGLIWAPLAAEVLACHLEGEPAPLGKDLLSLLDPARFALKEHRQDTR
ncbi:tRNA U-34 5-methylaminomethyl-2-thiouridine biosynthesis protein MnmC [Herbaspirillum sp. CF444]|uniref:FAD-dependent 5-carboxymethylaminomethyl-2-thiouridine(34) oxidoreductase MnmC n=1 Tax=Herbaspirillum sp. CF444 TaxID=1144319 RepID=UPI0002725264|nr:FAD-dependent 5-carboxymethylaminomethyl-2-thiouridine(34) oxidoreductase MnmC [Herbaspirillum sp. CF444]EJL81079.1 tRNA U-34 5-methylaminomethyl-2-thiouridine biosynthesis protein MnmC [Herbaspirillum sp. CF444]